MRKTWDKGALLVGIVFVGLGGGGGGGAGGDDISILAEWYRNHNATHLGLGPNP